MVLEEGFTGRLPWTVVAAVSEPGGWGEIGAKQDITRRRRGREAPDSGGSGK